MSNTSKNLLTFTASMLAIFGMLATIAYYVDKNYGEGTAGVVFAILLGVGLTMAIRTIGTFQDNRTHQSAGDDITSFAEAMSKTQMHAMRAQAELARADGAVRVVEAKAGLLTHKDELQRRQRIWRQADEDARRDAEAQRKQDQAEQDAQQSRQWWTQDADAVDVELQ